MVVSRMMLYSDNPKVYTACECQRPEPWNNIIDATLHNLGVNKYRIHNEECIVFMIKKELYEPTNLSFYIKALFCQKK